MSRSPCPPLTDAATGRVAVSDLIATMGFYSVSGGITLTCHTPVDAAIAAEPDLVPIRPRLR